MEPAKRSRADQLVLFVAQGFGSGNIPFAPGTFGSIVGLLWVYALVSAGSIWIYLGGIIAGFFFAVWSGERAELILGRKDPGSIVIDEIAALPLAFLPAALLGVTDWAAYLVAFGAFRIFDVAKPLGIARSQTFQWGLVIDDFLAALAAAPFVFLYCRFFA